MALVLSPIWTGVQFFSNTNQPLSGGKIFQYQAGTTIPQATYSDNSGVVPNANPIILDSSGRYPAQIWFVSGQQYKLILQDANGVILATEDNLIGINDAGGGGGPPTISEWVLSGLVPTYVSTTSFTVPTDARSTFQIGRRLQATVNAGVVYGTITSNTFSAGLTTVVCAMDSGAFDSGISQVNVGFLGEQNPSVPAILPYALTVKGLTSSAAVSVTGTVTATSFSGAGTGLTGTAASLTAGSANNSTTQAVGTNSTAIATTAFVQQAAFGLGGQAWSDVTASRAAGTTYNTTGLGRPIFVEIVTVATSNGASTILTVNGVAISNATQFNSAYRMWIAAIVPPNSTYSIAVTNASLSTWCECR